MEFVRSGGAGALYLLTDHLEIVVKIAHEDPRAVAEHAREQKTLTKLQSRNALIPHLVYCFHTERHFSFFPFIPNGTLADVLEKYSDGRQPEIPGPAQLNEQNINRWMQQICLAVAGLEAAGFAHGDIRLENIMLDRDHNIILIDLGRSVEIGTRLDVASLAYGRLLNEKDSEAGLGLAGTFGIAGARTETFAIGTVLYTLTRKHRPFENEDWGDEHGPMVIDMLQRKEFPSLTDSPADVIILKCWNGGFESVKQLLAEFPSQFDTQQEMCKDVIGSGILETVKRCHLVDDMS